MRVLFIRDHLAWSGGTIYFLETLPRLDSSRMQPTLCVLHPRSPVAEEFEAQGIRPLFLERPKRDPRRFSDLVRLSRNMRADLLHLSGPKSLLLGRLVARCTGIPAVAHLNNMLPEPRGMALIQRRLASSTAATLAVSHAVRQWAMRHYALPPERVEVLYPGHDLDRFPRSGDDMRAQVRHGLQIAGEAAVIGLVGRVAREKGQLLMVQLMPQLLKHRPSIVLLIVGDGPDLGDCQRLVAKLGLGAAVRFAGHRRDIPEVMAATDVVVVPSLCEEAFGLVAVEASAAGRPAVAFRSGGLSEVIIHNRTGLIVTKGDSAGLRNALEHVLSRPELARRLGESGRRHAAARFTIEPHVQRLMAFHEAVLSQRKLRTSLATPACLL